MNAQTEGQQTYFTGVIEIKAGRDLVDMPYPYIALTFDQEQVEGKVPADRSTRLEGDLTIHGVTRADHYWAVEGYSQSAYELEDGQAVARESIRLGSSIFNRALVDLGVRELRRSDEYARPGDTLIWNRKAEEWRPIPDLSLYYLLKVDSTSDLDKLVETMRAVPGVIGASKLPVPILDQCNIAADTVGTTNPIDLAMLVDYLFNGGAPPANCL